MRSRLVLAGALATVILLGSFPAGARVVPVRLDCTAGGVGDYWGDYEGGDIWRNIVAKGVCVGGDAYFDVTLTGSGYAVWYPNTASLKPTLRLTNPDTGKSVSVRQRWLGVSITCALNELVIRASNGVPVGVGSVTHCTSPRSDPPFTQRLGLRWTYLAWKLP